MYRLLALLPLLFLSACQSDNAADAGERRLDQVEAQERRRPLDYLELDGSYRKNLAGKTVVEGDIISTSTLVTYKDLVLEVTFFSATDTRLGRTKQTIYEFFPPGKRQSFTVRLDAPKDTEEVEVEMVGATAVVE